MAKRLMTCASPVYRAWCWLQSTWSAGAITTVSLSCSHVVDVAAHWSVLHTSLMYSPLSNMCSAEFAPIKHDRAWRQQICGTSCCWDGRLTIRMYFLWSHCYKAKYAELCFISGHGMHEQPGCLLPLFIIKKVHLNASSSCSPTFFT